jgi:hypothetical protein
MSLPPDNLPPLPVVPLPVEPFHPMNSGYPMRPRRPGIISFIAVTSIVVGSISILASAGFAFMDFGLVMAAIAPTPAPVSMTAASAVTGPPMVITHGTPERVPYSGLAYSDRQMFEIGLQQVRPLSAGQLEQLDEMLAENGKAIAGGTGAIPPGQVVATVTSSGHHPVGDTPGSDYFVMSTGRLELSNDRAVFFPTAGQPSIRSVAVQLPAPVFGWSPKSLQPYQIRSIVRAVNELNGAKIKSAQARTLAGTLQNPGQQLVVPTTDGSDPAYEVTAAVTDADGTLEVTTLHGTVSSTFMCDASGSIINQPVAPGVLNGRLTATPTANKTAGISAMSLSIAQLLPAIFLLVAGILTLRFSPRGRLLHWIYVAVKLPMGIATAAVSFWMWNSMLQSAMTMTTGPGAPPPPGAAAAGSAIASMMFGIVPATLGCLWPIVLMFLLSSRSTRLFYAGGTPAT